MFSNNVKKWISSSIARISQERIPFRVSRLVCGRFRFTGVLIKFTLFTGVNTKSRWRNTTVSAWRTCLGLLVFSWLAKKKKTLMLRTLANFCRILQKVKVLKHALSSGLFPTRCLGKSRGRGVPKWVAGKSSIQACFSRVSAFWASNN